MDAKYEGYVEKTVGVFRNKSKVWMVLGDTSLSFFKDQKRDSCIGSIDLTDITEVKSNDERSFVVITSSKTYTFTPDARQAVAEWIRVIDQSRHRDTGKVESHKSVFDKIDTVLPETQSSIFGVRLRSTRSSRSSDSDSRSSVQSSEARKSNVETDSTETIAIPDPKELSKRQIEQKIEANLKSTTHTQSGNTSIDGDCSVLEYKSGNKNTSEISKEIVDKDLEDTHDLNTTESVIETSKETVNMSAVLNKNITTSQNKSVEELKKSNSVSTEGQLNSFKNKTIQVKTNGSPLSNIQNGLSHYNSENVQLSRDCLSCDSKFDHSSSTAVACLPPDAQRDGKITVNDNVKIEKHTSSASVEDESPTDITPSGLSAHVNASIPVVVSNANETNKSDDVEICNVQMRRSSSTRQETVSEDTAIEDVDKSEVVMRKSSRSSRSRSCRTEQAETPVVKTTVSEKKPMCSNVPNTIPDDNTIPEDDVFVTDNVLANILVKDESIEQLPVPVSAEVCTEAIKKLKSYFVEHRNGFEYDLDRPVNGAVDRLRQYLKVKQ